MQAATTGLELSGPLLAGRKVEVKFHFIKRFRSSSPSFPGKLVCKLLEPDSVGNTPALSHTNKSQTFAPSVRSHNVDGRV